jgi:3-dehydroquinate dehydratase II
MTDVTDRPVVLVLHGPNLNLLGERELGIYGEGTLDELVAAVSKAAEERGLAIEHHQSNHEGELVDAIHAARGRCAAILVNPGAIGHYGWSLHDALRTFAGPIIEVHLSNTHAREPWRQTSVVSPVATGTIVGLGRLGYILALEAIKELLA